MVFVEWTGYFDEGYSGNDSTPSVTLFNNINEYASWKKQYYLDMSCIVPQVISPISGWYDEGKLVGIEYNDLPGIEFMQWKGEGNGSYTGDSLETSIEIFAPIKQEALIQRDDYHLEVISEYGETFGSGDYPAYENASFGIATPYVYLNKDVRMKFTGWTTNSPNGYEGNLTENNVMIIRDTEQKVNWIKQYYVNISSTEGGNVTAISDWIDSGTSINVSTTGENGYKFIKWSGAGDVSYNGNEKNFTLTVASAINQTAIWKKECTVVIDSILPTTGAGKYLEGDQVTLMAPRSEGLIVRQVFKKWSGGIDSNDPVFSFKISKDIHVIAEYEKNYTGFIALLVIALAIVALIAVKMLKT